MSRIILGGGTDAACMALFSLDDLPQQPDYEETGKMKEGGKLISINTDSDGAYLLHIYMNEDIPETIMKYCVLEEKQESDFNVKSGKIAFGGIESAYASFKPNSAIRTDAEIPAGKYYAQTYFTEYPGDYVEAKVQDVIGEEGMKYLYSPGCIIWLGVIFDLIILVWALYHKSYKLFIPMIIVLVVAVLASYFRTTTLKYRQYNQKKEEVELEYPGIVIKLTTC